MSDKWFYAKGSQRFGPLSSTQLKQVADSGTLEPTDMVWKDGAQSWVEAMSIRGLFPASSPSTSGFLPANELVEVFDGSASNRNHAGSNKAKLPGEEYISHIAATDSFLFIFPIGERKLTLTTHRVRYQRKLSGSGALKSIMLEHVSACMTTHESYPILLVLAGVFVLLGLFLGLGERRMEFFPIGLLVALAFLFAYLLSRQRVLRIASAGGAINFVLQGTLDIVELLAFINDLEAAKNSRYLTQETTGAKTATPI